MIDLRENILARLIEVVASIPNISSAYRNKAISDDTELPTVIVYDGNEEISGDLDLSARPASAPTVMQMTPEILIAQEADNIGSDLTAFRRELIKLVLYDTALNEQIVKTGRHGNGAIRYLGCETNISAARSPYGALLVRFVIKYTLKPDEL